MFQRRKIEHMQDSFEVRIRYLHLHCDFVLNARFFGFLLSAISMS